MNDTLEYRIARAQYRSEDFNQKAAEALDAGDHRLALHYMDRADVWGAEVARLSA